MRSVLTCVLAAAALFCSGCNKQRNLADIPILPNLTMDEYEEQVGTPSRIGNSNHWIAYNLKSGGELRLFFFNGPRGGRRTLSHAYVFDAGGHVGKHVFDLPAPEKPATNAATNPTTSPAETPKP